MNKRVWSIILLCLIIVLFIFTVVVFVNTGISLYQLENAEIDTSNDELPGASIIGVVFTSIALWIGFIFIAGMVSSIGFLCSLVNTKIAQNIIINRISKAFLYVYSVILILIFFISIFCIVFVFWCKINSNMSSRGEKTLSSTKSAKNQSY